MTQSVSLTALRTFVEVARLKSVKEAARSLGVTSGAVSQQVKVVEQRFNVLLFERSSRDIRLTSHGLRLLDAIHLPFQQIQDAVQDLCHQRPTRNVMRIITSPSFASSWLVPRLGRFSDRNPYIEIRVETSISHVDLRRAPFDVAIRYGSGDYDDLPSTKLISPRLVVVGSPRLLEGNPAIEGPEDCLNFPLLQDNDHADWPMWFRAHDVRTAEARAARGISFADDALLIAAAAASQGLALVKDIHAQDAISRNVIRIAHESSLSLPYSYFFVTQPDAVRKPHIQAFHDWLLEEISCRHDAAAAQLDYAMPAIAFPADALVPAPRV